jgi:hypothetical protein
MTEQQFNSPGFVYTWSEMSTGKIYCGSRKGTPNDSYICSSKTLLPQIKENPSDYIRKLEYVGIWGLAIDLEHAINRQLIKNLETTYIRVAGKTIVNEVHPLLGKKHRKESKQKQRLAKLGKTGILGNNFKSPIMATEIASGNTQVFFGNAELTQAGFQFQNVNHCLHGKRKSHKGHTFTRIKA